MIWWNWLIVVCSDGLMWRVESKSEFDWIWMVGLRWWYVDMYIVWRESLVMKKWLLEDNGLYVRW